MDYAFIEKFTPMYVEAAKITLYIAAISIVLALILGTIIGFIRYQKIPVLTQIAGIYIELSRNTPLLIQLFFLYFGLPKLGIVLDSMHCAIIGLTFQGGSYMAEAIRGGLDSIDKSQGESALSLGMSRFSIFKNVILPQAFTVSVPAICANVIFMIKETSVFSAVALADLMYVAKDLIGMYYKTEEALFMLVVSYLLILLPISILFSVIERRARYAGFGN
jgi:polar amino acid transport system permease protein